MSTTPDQTTVEIHALLGQQRELTELGLLDLHARYVDQPVRESHTFGEGEAQEYTIPGNPQEPFRGVMVLNPTLKTIKIGFGTRAALGSTLICPPLTAIVWPAVYTDLSLAVNQNDAQGALETVTILRLPYPPSQPASYPYGQPENFTTQTTGESEIKEPTAGHSLLGKVIGVGTWSIQTLMFQSGTYDKQAMNGALSHSSPGEGFFIHLSTTETPVWSPPVRLVVPAARKEMNLELEVLKNGGAASLYNLAILATRLS